MVFVRSFNPLTIWPELPIVLYLGNPLLIPYAAASLLWIMNVVLSSFSLYIPPYACHLVQKRGMECFQ